MKLLTFKDKGEYCLGVYQNDLVFPLREIGIDFEDMTDLIVNYSKYEDKIKEGLTTIKGICYTNIQKCAAIVHPKQDIICLGINYAAHAEESARYKKEAFGGERIKPIYFSKRVNKALGDFEDIDGHLDIVDSLDYEVELAVVIGKDAYKVAKEDVKDYIFGYTILNDISARNLQTDHQQWYFGKSLDDFTPIGPVIVTRDEIAYPPELSIKSFVNNELRQDSNTSMLINTIDDVIVELSAGITLKAGTIIAMGTPAGVGMGFVPPKFLNKGDSVVCEIEGIGEITNIIK